MTLTQGQLPAHNHAASSQLSVTLAATSSAATTNVPGGSSILAAMSGETEDSLPVTVKGYAAASAANTSLAGGGVTGSVEIGMTGGSQPFGIMQPYQAINFVICMFGIYPPRAD